MASSSWTVRGLRQALAEDRTTPIRLAEEALAHANQNAGKNTYLWHDAAWTLSEAKRAAAMPRGKGGLFGDGREPLWGIPVSVKDCFDLAGSPTTCGVKFYRDLNGKAQHDSWLVERLRAAGAVITGKTHLHPLAYGITGENPEFGDCLQPWDAMAFTGGSSSGAAASVQEGSAVAAIGTDTGGSVRAPASLCGLAGYRASMGRGDWRGGAHLAESFDTVGWLFRDPEDAPILASFFAPHGATPGPHFRRFAVINEKFLHDCDPAIVSALRATAAELETLGLRRAEFDASWWADSFRIFAPIQAREAARVHAGYFDKFEPGIRQRLDWGQRITAPEIDALRRQHAEFRRRLDALFAQHELLLLPAIPVTRLAAGADHGQTRPRLLRYTVPFSMGGGPVVTIPCSAGGMQLGAARDHDENLLQIAAILGAKKNTTAPVESHA